MNTDAAFRKLATDIADIAPLSQTMPVPRENRPLPKTPSRRPLAVTALVAVVIVGAAGLTAWWPGNDPHPGTEAVTTRQSTAPPAEPTPMPTSPPADAAGSSLQDLTSDDWLAATALPDGFEFMGATTWPSHRTIGYRDPASTRNDPRFIRITIYPYEHASRGDGDPIQLATGDQWFIETDLLQLERRFDWGVVTVDGLDVSLDQVIAAAESLVPVSETGFPRPIIDTLTTDGSTTVAEGTQDGRPVTLEATSDGLRFALSPKQSLLGGSNLGCCDALEPGEAMIISGSSGPIPTRFDPDGIADALYWGLVSPQVTEVRFELDNGTDVTVATQDLSGSFDVRFFIAGVPGTEGQLIRGTATAIGADGQPLATTGIEIDGLQN